MPTNLKLHLEKLTSGSAFVFCFNLPDHTHCLKIKVSEEKKHWYNKKKKPQEKATAHKKYSQHYLKKARHRPKPHQQQSANGPASRPFHELLIWLPNREDHSQVLELRFSCCLLATRYASSLLSSMYLLKLCHGPYKTTTQRAAWTEHFFIKGLSKNHFTEEKWQVMVSF